MITCPLTKRIEVPHTVSFYLKGSNMSLFLLYRQWFLKYRLIFKNVPSQKAPNFGTGRLKILRVCQILKGGFTCIPQALCGLDWSYMWCMCSGWRWKVGSPKYQLWRQTRTAMRLSKCFILLKWYDEVSLWCNRRSADCNSQRRNYITVICKHCYNRYTGLHKMQGHWRFNIIDKIFYEYTGSMHGFGYIWECLQRV